MNFDFNSNSSFANHMLKRLNLNSINIIVCNENFVILDITESAMQLFDVKVGENLADFVDYNVCLGFRKVILEKTTTVLNDKIDDVYFEIEADEHNGNAVLIFNELNHSRDISDMARATSNILNQYIINNDNLIKHIQVDQNMPSFLEERKSMHRLYDFNAKIELFIESDTINVPGFKTQNFSLFLLEFVENVRNTLQNTNIVTEIADNIICEFNHEKFTLALVNSLSNIFKSSQTDTLISIKLHEKNENIHLFISNNSDNSYNIDINSDEIVAIRRVLVLHKGNVFIKKTELGSELCLTFPIKQSSEYFFESHNEYHTKNLKSDRLIRTLELFNK